MWKIFHTLASYCEENFRRKSSSEALTLCVHEAIAKLLLARGSLTCSSSFSMAAARITSGPLRTCNQKIITIIIQKSQDLIFIIVPRASCEEALPTYLTAYSIVLMHGLMFSIWRHLPLAPFNADMFLVDTDPFTLLMHWIWDNDCDDDRHKLRLSQLDDRKTCRVATVFVKESKESEELMRERDWYDSDMFTTAHMRMDTFHVGLTPQPNQSGKQSEENLYWGTRQK